MVRFLDTIYSGAVLKNTEDVLSVCVNLATEQYGQFAETIKDVRLVDELHDDGTLKNSYVVSGPKLSSVIAANLIYIEFAMKPPLVKQLEATLQELSDTVDQLLIDSLEG